ncbi:winged helix-turn-helix domain-containing protein [Altererythrobacter sp. SALINAS58]|uniref:helix-turn-helix domain-containing protein n=1 Tax=Alteripontixanthobacter muriae TaxID=2705546 RepID=UPI0015764CC8|nr:helix-turn-helix domain-containing protein [Alteripontixanthobacter muriae]NTZ43225.1 winged helix-turn-helix domain-containing protein [Alteripontixanthobacter muriae]
MAHVFRELGSRMDAIGLTQEHGYELPMTQEELADVLDLTAVHVDRMLKAHEVGGLITRTRRNMSFPGWEKMREACYFDQCFRYPGQQEPFLS